MNFSKLNLSGSEYKVKDEKAREDIESINTIIETINTNIENNLLNNTIFIGDSYGYQDEMWPSKVASLLGLTMDENAFNFCTSGAGFVRENNTFLQQLQNGESVITDKSLIKNIVVCGGANDVVVSSQSDIQTAISTFVTYCKTNYPNATIYVGMIGGFAGINDSNELRNKLRDMVLPAYQSISSFGGLYLNGVEYIMKFYGFYDLEVDGTHPTSTGQSFIARGIYQALTTGYSSLNTSEVETILECGCRVQQKILNNKLITYFYGNITSNLPTSSSVGSKTIVLGTPNGGYFRFTDEKSKIPCTLLINRGGTYSVTNGTISVNTSGELTLTFYNTDTTNITAMSILNNQIENELLYF